MCIHGINDDSRILVLFNEHKSGKIEGLPGPMTNTENVFLYRKNSTYQYIYTVFRKLLI